MRPIEAPRARAHPLTAPHGPAAVTNARVGAPAHPEKRRTPAKSHASSRGFRSDARGLGRPRAKEKRRTPAKSDARADGGRSDARGLGRPRAKEKRRTPA